MKTAKHKPRSLKRAQKLNEVHDILNMIEVKHAKADKALTEIKMLCAKKK